MRLFIAVPLPDNIKEALLELREPIEGVRWQKPEQLHLTLKFLGDTQREEVSQIQQELSQLSADPFSLDIKGLGRFPRSGFPKVIWAGIAPNDPLMQLQGKVEESCSKIGFPPEERNFHPHITLGRVKQGAQTAVESLVERYTDFLLDGIAVDRIVLYESQLQPEGAVHNPLKIFSLK